MTLDLPIGRSPVVGLTTRRTVETFIFAPFLLYLATKPTPVTRTEQRLLLGGAGLLAIVEYLST